MICETQLFRPIEFINTFPYFDQLLLLRTLYKSEIDKQLSVNRIRGSCARIPESDILRGARCYIVGVRHREKCL